jgi:hypothetical protein
MNAKPTKTTEAENPFDPSNLRLSQDYAAHLGVKKVLTTIPVRKPGKQDFVRTHPDESYRLETMVLELKEERETYLVDPELWPELHAELTPKLLITSINRQGVLSIWPIRLPGEDGRIDNWSASAMDAAARARERWLRMSSNMSLGAYEICEATGDLPEPEWPDLSFPEILNIAFRAFQITDLSHSIVKRLRGVT